MTDAAFPEVFPDTWASAWGEDEIGLWCAVTVKGVAQRLRWIEPGTFLMGSPEEELERDDDETQHRVTLTRGYWLAETACSQAFWEAVTGENPSHFRGDDLPIEQVSWEDVGSFLETLNGLRPGLGARLPTEAEWEYACRAGTTTPFSFGDQITTDQVNYDGNAPYAGGVKGKYRAKTVPVTDLPANAWGLYQMHGNVWEWCSDWFGKYPAEAMTNPVGPDTGAYRVVRGGSWIYDARIARAAGRVAVHPSLRSPDLGFRFARGQGP